MTHEDILEQSLAEIQSQLEKHHRLVKSALGRSVLDAHAACSRDGCRHQKALCRLLLEGVKVLDETRKSFKSRPLELLRKRFVDALTEQMEDSSSSRQ